MNQCPSCPESAGETVSAVYAHIMQHNDEAGARLANALSDESLSALTHHAASEAADGHQPFDALPDWLQRRLSRDIYTRAVADRLTGERLATAMAKGLRPPSHLPGSRPPSTPIIQR